MTRILEKLRNAYERADRVTGGRLEIIKVSYLRFIEMRGLQAAAALAYYALFSLFPLMLLLVWVLGFLLSSSEQAYYQTLQFVWSAVPVSRKLIQENLSEILRLRGSVGAIGLLGLLWASSHFFTILAFNVNMAWPSVRLRNLMQGRLVALAMLGGLFLLLLLSLVSTSLVQGLPALMQMLQIDPGLLDSPLWRGTLRLVPGAFSFLLFCALYGWVPNKVVRWNAVVKGALAAALAWETAKWLFSVIVVGGIVNYEFVYGSMGALAALLVWIYLSSVIALAGAHLVATLDMLEEQALDKEQATSGHRQGKSGMTDVAEGIPYIQEDQQAYLPVKGFGTDDPARLKAVQNNKI